MADYTPTTDDIRSAATQDVTVDGTVVNNAFLQMAFDRWLAAHDAEVREAAYADGVAAGRDYGYAAAYDDARASLLAEQGEPEGQRWFSAAYRARNGNVIPIGDENILRQFPEAIVEEFRREDPDGPDYFLASRILPPWLPVEENGETDG